MCYKNETKYHHNGDTKVTTLVEKYITKENLQFL
jgi:hypothetical protein